MQLGLSKSLEESSLDEKTLNKMKSELCTILTRIDALKFGSFKLTSGKLSPYYVDLRLVPSYPGAFEKIISLYVGMARETVGLDSFDRVAGIPTAGIPFSSVLSFQLKKPFLYVRKGEKEHGMGKRVEGLLMPGDRVLLVDDLITTGKSLLESAEKLKAEGAVVNDALVLLDREEGGLQNLAKVGVNVHALLEISEATEILYGMGRIDKIERDAILKQIKSR